MSLIRMLPPDLFEEISSAVAAGKLFGGGLVRPIRSEQPWHIATDVPPSALALFRQQRREIVLNTDVVDMNLDWPCWVFVYRVGDVEHRVFLPLVGKLVAEFISSVRCSDLGIQMDAKDSDAVLEIRSPTSAELRRALRQQWRESVDGPDCSAHILSTAVLLLAPAALLNTSRMQLASTVSVTAVIPEDLRLDIAEETAATLTRASGRKPHGPG